MADLPDKTVNILGSEWVIKKQTKEENNKLDKCDGYCDWSVRCIVVDTGLEESSDSLGDLDVYIKSVMRHEIVHAFLVESGLVDSSHSTDMWARDEEMVDWFARQGPKIYKAWQEADCAE